MSTNSMLNLLQLPIELLFRILDQLDELTIFISMRNVCRRLNAITDAYRRYQLFKTLNLSKEHLVEYNLETIIRALHINTVRMMLFYCSQ